MTWYTLGCAGNALDDMCKINVLQVTFTVRLVATI